MLMKNPLMADLHLSNIKLICRFEDSDINNTDIEQVEKSMILKSLEMKEIIIELIPKRAGKFIIERIEW
jgi:hypothetical protein